VGAEIGGEDNRQIHTGVQKDSKRKWLQRKGTGRI